MRISRHALALLCAAFVVACNPGAEPGPTGNTELNLDVVNPGGDTGAGFSIDRVDYRITCAGSPPGTYDIPPADTNGTDYNYDDAVDISGAFETVDTRDPPVWQAVMDLPPGDCTIALSVYEDDEIVCVGSQTLAIAEDATTKYDIVLVCSLSIDTPDGMADVDGTFEFITGNLCPKLYVLNAIPSTATVDTGTGIASAEIQYRAKDPDDTCGNNCDPQSCTTDNPPVCTPYPSNINDPACNAAAGGDPNSAACLAGDFAGLVCTIAAIPTASGVPGGTFINPQDGVTPVGPVLPVNLNLAAGIPGIILPGLGGPADTNAANSPAYPPLPNVNGSLPPLVYQCDLTQPGPVVINLDCSDGDAECDQNKQIFVTCPGENFCVSQPVVCDSGNECTTNGTCNPFCDPADTCDRCSDQDDPVADGTPCTEGGGNECLAGVCVECSSDAVCADIPSTPVDCQLPNTCDLGTNTCSAGGTAPAGTPCSNGECDGSGIGPGACQFAILDPGAQSRIITVSCGNNVTADVSILPFELDVETGPLLGEQGFFADFGGVAEFSETFLDAAQGAVPGGVTKALLVDLKATVQVRSGATGPDIVLSAGGVIPYECALDDTGPGAQVPCDPANDQASVPGLQPNTDCVPTGSFNPCGRVVVIPTSSDCAAGGTCDSLGKAAQCTANGFCVTGGLPLPLDPDAGFYTAEPSGNILFGWADTPPNPSAVGQPSVDPDGTWNMLQPTYTGMADSIGLAVNAGGLAVQLECVMGVDSGGPDGVGIPDDGSPTPDSSLISFPIQVCGGPCPTQCQDANNSGGSNPNCPSDAVDCREPSVCLSGVCQPRPISPDGTPCSLGACVSGACTGCLEADNVGGMNPSCDSSPVDCLEPSICVGNACQPREVSPDGTLCSTGICEGGVCTGCLDGENSAGTNPNCDSTPIDCLEPSICLGNACQSRAVSADGTPCSIGICSGGVCVGCLDSENSGGTNPTCDNTPTDCLEPSICAGGVCQPRETSPDGTPCSVGVCQSGGCGFDPCDPCTGECGLASCSKIVEVTCRNNITADVSLLPFDLDVDPTPIVANQPFSALVGGQAVFDEVFLDAAQGAIPGGVTKASVVDLKATVQTRGAGATGPDLPLSWGASVPYECVLADTGPGAQEPCDPGNDLASIPGLRGNADCVPTGNFNPCLRMVTLPTSADCAAGGLCDTLGKASQCTANGFCITGGLPLPLDAATGNYVAGDGVSSGQTLARFGWFDDPADASPAVAFPAVESDLTWNLVSPVYGGVAGPVGLAVNASGLAVQLECVQGVLCGGSQGTDGCPSPDFTLLAFPVQTP